MHNLVKLSKCSTGEEEKRAVCRVMDDGYLGMGQEVMLFEKELEQFFSHKTNVVCVNTGTSALQLALQGCDIGLGDEVLIPSITYVASFQATSAIGATPIACDINLNTGCLDVYSARSKITKHTKAIMYVHYASGVGDRDSIFGLAKEFGLRIIEDAAHSFGGYHNGIRIGEDSDVMCFSFDGIKNITCGEGGAIVSSDKKVINKVRDLRLLGVEKDSDQRYAGKRSWDFDVKEQGWRYHMSNINAAIGREQLKKIDIFTEKKRDLIKSYMNFLKECPVAFLNLDIDNIASHIFPVLIKDGFRGTLQQFLLEKNIETGVHYKPNHFLTKYSSGQTLPAAEQFGREVLSLPLHVGLDYEHVEEVAFAMMEYYKSS